MSIATNKKINYDVFSAYCNALSDNDRRTLASKLQSECGKANTTVYYWMTKRRFPQKSDRKVISNVIGIAPELLFPGHK